MLKPFLQNHFLSVLIRQLKLRLLNNFFNNFSGALDTASRQLDQMIDKARYCHHQHRGKFKEAIDYLDQIFEDLRKECDPKISSNVKF